MKHEGFYLAPSTITGIICKTGHWCPALGGGEEMYLCPGGTYGSSTGLTVPTCSGKCQAGCVCEAGSVANCPGPCPAGYYCLEGTGGPILPIICPQGYYCPSKSTQPTLCPAGKYCPPGTISI